MKLNRAKRRNTQLPPKEERFTAVLRKHYAELRLEAKATAKDIV